MEKLKVLFVDDDDITAFLFKKITSSVFETTHFSNPPSAIENCRLEDFDLIITDAYMPLMSGFEFLDYMQEKGVQVPAIFSTSSVYKTDYDKAAAMPQVVAFLSKPISMDNLLALDILKERIEIVETEIMSSEGQPVKRRMLSLKN